MTNDQSALVPWGKYRPRGRDWLLQAFTRLGLSRGEVKNIIRNLYQAQKNSQPVDIRRFGVKWRLHPWNNLTEAKILCASKPHDHQELKVITKALRNQGTLVDIGANAGYYTLMAAAHGAGKILALEPNPTMFARLLFNIELNNFGDRVTALQLGAGSQVGKMELFLHSQDLGGSSMLPGSPHQQSITVPVKPLRTILSENTFDHVDVLKIDVEGMETEILVPFFQEAVKSSWPRMLLIEHAHLNSDGFDLLASLLKQGYNTLLRNRSNTVLAKAT